MVREHIDIQRESELWVAPVSWNYQSATGYCMFHPVWSGKKSKILSRPGTQVSSRSSSGYRGIGESVYGSFPCF